jgi:hypothetical protein
MKYYTFKRESNDFDDILSDNVIKQKIKTKVSWSSNLLLGFSDNNDNLFGYIVLKYGDSIVNPFEKDFKPIMGIDYHLTK